MSSLRERIDQEVYEAYQAGIDHNQVPFKYPAMGKSEIQEATERIIAVFEAVLLSDEVVEAAAKGMWDSDMEAESDSHIPWDECEPHQEPWREEERHQARAALQAALAAVEPEPGLEDLCERAGRR